MFQERKKEYEADFVKFGTTVQELAATGTATVGADGTVQAESNEMTLAVIKSFVEEGPQGANFNETIQLIKKIPGSEKTEEVLLIEARCHELLGNHKSALSAAGRLIQKAASYEPWINDSPRMMAATLGANAAMQLGLSENALSFYQTVLKFDPEQPRARKQYRGLKKVVKLLNKAEEQVRNSFFWPCNLRCLYLGSFVYSLFLERVFFLVRSKKATTRLHLSLSTIAFLPFEAWT